MGSDYDEIDSAGAGLLPGQKMSFGAVLKLMVADYAGSKWAFDYSKHFWHTSHGKLVGLYWDCRKRPQMRLWWVNNLGGAVFAFLFVGFAGTLLGLAEQELHFDMLVTGHLMLIVAHH